MRRFDAVPLTDLSRQYAVRGTQLIRWDLYG